MWRQGKTFCNTQRSILILQSLSIEAVPIAAYPEFWTLTVQNLCSERLGALKCIRTGSELYYMKI